VGENHVGAQDRILDDLELCRTLPIARQFQVILVVQAETYPGIQGDHVEVRRLHVLAEIARQFLGNAVVYIERERVGVEGQGDRGHGVVLLAGGAGYQ